MNRSGLQGASCLSPYSLTNGSLWPCKPEDWALMVFVHPYACAFTCP